MAASNPHGDKAHLIPPTTLTRLVQGWLEEDCPSFDVGGYIVGEEVMEATLLAKSPVSPYLIFHCLPNHTSPSISVCYKTYIVVYIHIYIFFFNDH